MVDGVASAVAVGGTLAPIQRSLLDSLMPAMTGHRGTVPESPSMTPADFAQRMARREPSFRTRMVQVMLLSALLIQPIPEEVAERIAATAEELGVEDGMVDVALDLAAGSMALATQDFVRNGYEGTWHAEDSDDDAALGPRAAEPGSSRSTTRTWRRSGHRSGRWRQTPSGARSGSCTRHVVSRSRAPRTRRRRCWPSTTGYTYWPTTARPSSRRSRCSVSFHGRTTTCTPSRCWPWCSRSSRPGSCRMRAGLFDASPGHFSGDPGMAIRLSDAMRRGALCHDARTGADSIDFLRLDWFSVAHVPCAELRERFHVVAKAEEAVAAGSVGPWEPGGISPFQMNAGQAMAAARGVPYDGPRRFGLRATTRGSAAPPAPGGGRSRKRGDRAWRRCWRRASRRPPR